MEGAARSYQTWLDVQGARYQVRYDIFEQRVCQISHILRVSPVPLPVLHLSASDFEPDSSGELSSMSSDPSTLTASSPGTIGSPASELTFPSSATVSPSSGYITGGEPSSASLDWEPPDLSEWDDFLDLD